MLEAHCAQEASYFLRVGGGLHLGYGIVVVGVWAHFRGAESVPQNKDIQMGHASHQDAEFHISGLEAGK